MVLLGLIVLTIALAVRAELSASYPINAQLPPVARVSEPFKFVFSEGTFGGTGEAKKYSLDDAPSWLHVDSESRTLSGTPQADDVGRPKFNLVAKCPSGSASMEVTLAVSSEDGPKFGKPLLPQLEKAGPTSASATPTFFCAPWRFFLYIFRLRHIRQHQKLHRLLRYVAGKFALAVLDGLPAEHPPIIWHKPSWWPTELYF